MTAKAVRDEAFDDADLPVPPWVRPLSLAEQDTLIQEADEDIAAGRLVGNHEANRMIDGMIARLRAL